MNTSWKPKRRPQTARCAQRRSGRVAASAVLRRRIFTYRAQTTASDSVGSRAVSAYPLAGADTMVRCNSGTRSGHETRWCMKLGTLRAFRSLTAIVVLHKPHRRTSQIPETISAKRWLALRQRLSHAPILAAQIWRPKALHESDAEIMVRSICEPGRVSLKSEPTLAISRSPFWNRRGR